MSEIREPEIEKAQSGILRTSSILSGRKPDVFLDRMSSTPSTTIESQTKPRATKMTILRRGREHRSISSDNLTTLQRYPRKRSSYLENRRLSISRILAAIGVRRENGEALSRPVDSEYNSDHQVDNESGASQAGVSHENDSAFANDIYVKTKILEDELSETVRRKRLHPHLVKFYERRVEADYLLRNEDLHVRQSHTKATWNSSFSLWNSGDICTTSDNTQVSVPPVYLTTSVWGVSLAVLVVLGLLTYTTPLLRWIRLAQCDNINRASLTAASARRNVRYITLINGVAQATAVAMSIAASLITLTYLAALLSIESYSVVHRSHGSPVTWEYLRLLDVQALIACNATSTVDVLSAVHFHLGLFSASCVILVSTFYRSNAGNIWIPNGVCGLLVLTHTVVLGLMGSLWQLSYLVAFGVLVVLHFAMVAFQAFRREKTKRLEFLKQCYRDKAREHMLIKAELEQEAKNRFLASVTHELRTPIHGVLGLLTVLEESGITTEQKENLQLMKDSMNGLLSLVNDILDASKLEAGQFSLTEEVVNLREKVETLMSAMEPFANRVGVDLLCYIEPHAPEKVLVDWKRFSQCITNLVSNAIKFSPSEKTVIVNVGSLPGMAVATSAALTEGIPRRLIYADVEDEGIGIREADLDRVFERFTQLAEDNHERVKGTGIVPNVLSYFDITLSLLMGGDISVSSTYGKGSSFRVTVAAGIVQDKSGYDDGLRNQALQKRRVRRATIQGNEDKSTNIQVDTKLHTVDTDNRWNDDKAADSTTPSAHLDTLFNETTQQNAQRKPGSLKKRFTSPAYTISEADSVSEGTKPIKKELAQIAGSPVPRRPILIVSDKKGVTKVMYKYCYDLGFQPVPCSPKEGAEKYGKLLTASIAGCRATMETMRGDTDDDRSPLGFCTFSHMIVDCAIGIPNVAHFLHDCMLEEARAMITGSSSTSRVLMPIQGQTQVGGPRGTREMKNYESDTLRSIAAAEDILFGSGSGLGASPSSSMQVKKTATRADMRQVLPRICLLHQPGWNTTRDDEFDLDFSLVPQHRLTMLAKPIRFSALKAFIANNNSRNVEDLSAKGPEVNTVHDGLRPSFFGLTGTAPRSQRDGAPMLSTPSCSRTAERPNTISGSQPGGRGRSASRQKQVKVLVVDDDPLNRRFVSAVLSKHGIVCEAVDTAEEATNRIGASMRYRSNDALSPVVGTSGSAILPAVTGATCAYDIILMDWHMPKMPGTTCTRNLRSRGLITPIVGITASSSETEREECLASGMTDILPKPFGPNELLPLIERLARAQYVPEAEEAGKEYLEYLEQLSFGSDGRETSGHCAGNRSQPIGKERYLVPVVQRRTTRSRSPSPIKEEKQI